MIPTDAFADNELARYSVRPAFRTNHAIVSQMLVKPGLTCVCSLRLSAFS